MEAWDIFPGIKRQESEADYSSPSNTSMNNTGIISAYPYMSPLYGAYLIN
jgi:hypothetical protein